MLLVPLLSTFTHNMKEKYDANSAYHIVCRMLKEKYMNDINVYLSKFKGYYLNCRNSTKSFDEIINCEIDVNKDFSNYEFFIPKSGGKGV